MMTAMLFLNVIPSTSHVSEMSRAVTKAGKNKNIIESFFQTKLMQAGFTRIQSKTVIEIFCYILKHLRGVLVTPGNPQQCNSMIAKRSIQLWVCLL